MIQPFYLLLTQPDHSSMRSSTRQQQQQQLHLPTIPEDCEVQVVCDEQYQKTRRQRHLEGLLIKVARVLLLSVLAIALLSKPHEVAESVASAAHAEAHHALLEEDSAPGELRHLLRGGATPSVVATPAVAMVETMPRHISTTVWQQHDDEPPQAQAPPQTDMVEQPLRIAPQYDHEVVEEEEEEDDDASPALWQPEEPQQPQQQEPQEKTEWQPQQIAPSSEEQPLQGLEEVDEAADDDETTSYIPHDDFLVPEDAEPTPVFNEEQQYYEEESSVIAEPQRSLDEVQVQPPLQEGTNNVDVVATTVDDVEAPQQQQQQPPLAEHETFLIPPMRR